MRPKKTGNDTALPKTFSLTENQFSRKTYFYTFATSELGGTTPLQIGGVSATSEATDDGLARTPSAPRDNSNEVSTSFESQLNYVKNCHATPSTPKKVSQNTQIDQFELSCAKIIYIQIANAFNFVNLKYPKFKLPFFSTYSHLFQRQKIVDQLEKSSESEAEQEFGPKETVYRNLVKTIQAKLKPVKPTCKCSVEMAEPENLMSGPFYAHLGHAPDLAELRRDMEERTGLTSEEVRIEKVRYRRKEGKTSHGCPIAKFVSSNISRIHYGNAT